MELRTQLQLAVPLHGTIEVALALAAEVGRMLTALERSLRGAAARTAG